MKAASVAVGLMVLGCALAGPVRGQSAYPQWDGKETIAAYAQRAKLAPERTLNLGGGVKWVGELIPAGTFTMGSPPGEAKTEHEAAVEKQHRVTLTRSFYMGKFELTQAQYARV